LRQALEGRGSPLYGLTWKPWAMESGPPICALRASAPRTSDSGCGGEASGWPTPDASAFEAKDLKRLEARRAECKVRTGNGNGFGLTLGQAAPLMLNQDDPARLTSTGEMLTGSDAGMDGGGRLNPRHACWLMGYPHEWDDIAQTVTLPPRGRALRAKAGKHGA
jgi:hypothetical protein